MSQYETKSFTNIDSEEFIGRYAGEDYPIGAGETKAFPAFLVEHFCKHLADKILARENKLGNDAKRAELVAKMQSGGPTIPATPQPKKTEGEKIKDIVRETQEEIEEFEAKRKEEIKAKRLAALAKAREAKKAKK